MTNTTITEITGIAQKLLKAREEVQAIDVYLKDLKANRDELQLILLSSMRDTNLSQWKISEATISRVSKQNVFIMDETKVINELRSRNLYKDYVFEKIDSSRFKVLAKSLTEKGQLLEGTQVEERDYISIRCNKSKTQSNTIS